MSDTANNTNMIPLRNAAGSMAGREEDLAKMAAAPASTEIAAPASTEIAAPASTEIAAPASTEIAAPASTEIAAPADIVLPAAPSALPEIVPQPESSDTAQLMGNFYKGVDSSTGQVKITATKGNDPTIIRINTNGEEFIVNIPVAGPSAQQELANAIHYGKGYETKPSIAATPESNSTEKPGLFNRMGRIFGKRSAKVASIGGRGGNTKKNRKHRTTKSNRKRVRPSRRR